MAADPAVEEGVRDLEKEITCAICHEHYTEPKVLPCCHYYCKQCLHKLTLRTGINKPFSCPECRKETTLPEGGLDNLPSAFFVNRMMEVHSKLERAHGKEETKSCELHYQPMNLYCFICKSLICRDCTITQHHNHSCEFVNVIKQRLLQELNPLRKIKTNMLRAMDGICTTISEVEDEGRSVAKHIESSFAELQKIIDNHKQQLLTEARAVVKCKSQHLSKQEEGLSNACVAIDSVINYTEQCVEHSADDEIMCMHTEIQNRIDREIEEERKDLEPAEEVDLGVEVNCSQDLKQLLQTKAVIIECNRIEHAITGEGLKSAEINNLSLKCRPTYLMEGQLNDYVQ